MSELFINFTLLYGSPLALACALIHFGFWMLDRPQKAYLYWGTTNLIGAGSMLLYLLPIPMPWLLSLLVYNGLFITIGIVLWAGLRRFAGQPVRAGSFMLFLAAFLAVFAAVALSFDGVGPRIVLVSLVMAGMNLGMAAELRTQQGSRFLIMRQVLIFAMLAHALFYLVRAGRVLYAGPEADLVHTAAEIDLVLTVGMLKTTIWNLAAVLMVREARGMLGFGERLRTRHPDA